MPRGRQKGRVYPDMLVRGLGKAHRRLALVIESIKDYNATASKYERSPVPKKELQRLEQVANALTGAAEKIMSL